MGQHDDKKGTENTNKELKRQQKALSFLEDFSRKIAAFFMCTFLRIFRKKQIIFLYACAGAPERAKACTAVAIKASQSGVALHSPQPSAFHAFDLVRRGLPFGGNAFYACTPKAYVLFLKQKKHWLFSLFKKSGGFFGFSEKAVGFVIKCSFCFILLYFA